MSDLTTPCITYDGKNYVVATGNQCKETASEEQLSKEADANETSIYKAFEPPKRTKDAPVKLPKGGLEAVCSQTRQGTGDSYKCVIGGNIGPKKVPDEEIVKTFGTNALSDMPVHIQGSGNSESKKGVAQAFFNKLNEYGANIKQPDNVVSINKSNKNTYDSVFKLKSALGHPPTELKYGTMKKEEPAPKDTSIKYIVKDALSPLAALQNPDDEIKSANDEEFRKMFPIRGEALKQKNAEEKEAAFVAKLKKENAEAFLSMNPAPAFPKFDFPKERVDLHSSTLQPTKIVKDN